MEQMPHPHSSPHYTTATSDKVPLSQKWLYSLATVALIPGMQVIDRIAQVVLNVGLSVDPMLIGVALAIFRLDAFFDPMIGAWSDNCRSRWGRRKPFIVFGGVLCAATFPLMWMMSREWAPMTIFYYFVATGLVYYLALSIYSVPYWSLSAEMTSDTHERTNVIAFRGVVINVVTIAMGWLLWFVTLGCFKDMLEGTRWLAFATAGLFVTFGVIPMLFVKEPFYEQASKQKKISVWESLKDSLSNRTFIVLVAMMLLMTLGMQSVGTLGLYVSIYYVFSGDKAAAGLVSGYAGTAMMVLSIVTIPLFAWMAKKFGKVPALYACGTGYLLATLSQWFLVTPAHPYWQIASTALIGPVVTGVWIILPSMQTDVIDYDELLTGYRREGSFTAILGWIQKLGFALSVFLAGVILDVSGFEIALEAAQTPETLRMMRILFVFFPVVMAIAMLLLVRFYPLNERRCHEIRQKLEARRGVIHAE